MEREEQNNQEEQTSVRVRLVQAVIEYYMDNIHFELLDIDVLELKLQNTLNGLLGFETKAGLARDAEATLNGSIAFIDGDGQQAGLKTVNFQVIISGSEVGPFDQDSPNK